MAIDDPTAIPQNPDQVAEYMREADRLWHDNRTEEAHTLYRSVFNGTSAGPESSLAGYRLALYLQTMGDIDGALTFAAYTNEPGTADLLVALRAAMPDQAVDPSVVPITAEACERYLQSIDNAFNNSDWTTVDALVPRLSADTGRRRGRSPRHLPGVPRRRLGAPRPQRRGTTGPRIRAGQQQQRAAPEKRPGPHCNRSACTFKTTTTRTRRPIHNGCSPASPRSRAEMR